MTIFELEECLENIRTQRLKYVKHYSSMLKQKSTRLILKYDIVYDKKETLIIISLDKELYYDILHHTKLCYTTLDLEYVEKKENL